MRQQLPGGDPRARVAAAGREALGCTEQGLFATHFCVSLQTVLAATALYPSLSLVGSMAARAPTGRRETNQGISLPRAELLHLCGHLPSCRQGKARERRI